MVADDDHAQRCPPRVGIGGYRLDLVVRWRNYLLLVVLAGLVLRDYAAAYRI